MKRYRNVKLSTDAALEDEIAFDDSSYTFEKLDLGLSEEPDEELAEEVLDIDEGIDE